MILLPYLNYTNFVATLGRKYLEKRTFLFLLNVVD